MTSPSFVIVGNSYTFLIGGSCNMSEEVRAELIVEGNVVLQETGNCRETITEKSWDVSKYTGKQAQLRLIDSSSGNWGHINFDQFKEICRPHCGTVFDFEKDLSEWNLTGTAFNNQPTYGDNTIARGSDPSNYKGDWWIGGYENRTSPSQSAGAIQGDGPQGSMTSPSFVIVGNSYTFLIGRSCNISEVRAELIVEGNVVLQETGNCNETMTKKSWDVSKYTGKQAQLRLIDSSSGNWGHINFDQFKEICP